MALRVWWKITVLFFLALALAQGEVDPREEAKLQKLLLETTGILTTKLFVEQGKELFNRTQHMGGFAAPCRFFVMQMGPDVLVGAIEPMLMTIMPGVMGTPAVPMLQEARRVMTEILEAAGGTPYRPGQ